MKSTLHNRVLDVKKIFIFLEPSAKFHRDCKKCQGTTLVVPEDQQKRCWALAPWSFIISYLQFLWAKARSFRCTCGTTKVVP